MTGATFSRKERLHRRGVRLEVFTIAWNAIEAFVAIGVGLLVGSVALVGFGVGRPVGALTDTVGGTTDPVRTDRKVTPRVR